MAEIVLREYQEIAIKSVSQDKNTLLQLATGAGKSLIIAGICNKYSDKKILVLAHRASLLFQNCKILKKMFTSSTGFFCAELGEKDLSQQVTFASRSSLANLQEIPQFDLIIIDEVHLLNEEKGQYFKILNSQGVFEEIPRTQIIGLTATPWRNNLPMFGKEQLFTKIDLEVLTDDLIQQGFLAPYFFPKVKKEKIIDVSSCRKQNGDYSLADLEKFTSSDEIIKSCLQEWNALASERKLHLFFCTGVKHAERVSELLVSEGYLNPEEILTITGTTKDKVEVIASVQTNTQIKAICSCEVLTTGTDIPRIDTIVMLRPTQSAVLHVQMNGRGLRLSEGKKDCAIIDLAGNMTRFGSLNKPYLNQKAPVIFEQSSETEFVDSAGVGKLKKCTFCSLESPVAARVCKGCNNLFIKKVGMFDLMDTDTYEVCSYTLKDYHTCSTGNVAPLLIVWDTLSHGKIHEYFWKEWKAARIKQYLDRICSIRGAMLKKNGFKMINVSKYNLNENEYIEYKKLPNFKYTDFILERE